MSGGKDQILETNKTVDKYIIKDIIQISSSVQLDQSFADILQD